MTEDHSFPSVGAIVKKIHLEYPQLGIQDLIEVVRASADKNGKIQEDEAYRLAGALNSRMAFAASETIQ